MLAVTAGAILSTEALWQLVCLWRRRLARNAADNEIVEVLFFPDLPADLFKTSDNCSREELVGSNMYKVYIQYVQY
jgi:hypothetical protein